MGSTSIAYPSLQEHEKEDLQLSQFIFFLYLRSERMMARS